MTPIQAPMETNPITNEAQLFSEGLKSYRKLPQVFSKWMIEALPDIQQVNCVSSILKEGVKKAG